MITVASPKAVESIRYKFQFLAAITLFFPVTLQAVFTAFEQVQVDYKIMSWGMVVAFLVMNYLLIEFLKDKMRPYFADVVRTIICLSILSYVPVFVVLSGPFEPLIPISYGILFMLGFVGTMVLPVLLFLILSIYAVMFLIGLIEKKLNNLFLKFSERRQG